MRNDFPFNWNLHLPPHPASREWQLRIIRIWRICCSACVFASVVIILPLAACPGMLAFSHTSNRFLSSIISLSSFEVTPTASPSASSVNYKSIYMINLIIQYKMIKFFYISSMSSSQWHKRKRRRKWKEYFAMYTAHILHTLYVFILKVSRKNSLKGWLFLMYKNTFLLISIWIQHHFFPFKSVFSAVCVCVCVHLHPQTSFYDVIPFERQT